MKQLILLLSIVGIGILGMEEKSDRDKNPTSSCYYVLTNPRLVKRANEKPSITVSTIELSNAIAFACKSGVNPFFKKKIGRFFGLTAKKIMKTITSLQEQVAKSKDVCVISPKNVAYLATCLAYQKASYNWFDTWIAEKNSDGDFTVTSNITITSSKQGLYTITGEFAEALHGFKALEALSCTGRIVSLRYGSPSGETAACLGLHIHDSGRMFFYTDFAINPILKKALKQAMEATHDPVMEEYQGSQEK